MIPLSVWFIPIGSSWFKLLNIFLRSVFLSSENFKACDLVFVTKMYFCSRSWLLSFSFYVRRLHSCLNFALMIQPGELQVHARPKGLLTCVVYYQLLGRLKNVSLHSPHGVAAALSLVVWISENKNWNSFHLCPSLHSMTYALVLMLVSV